MFAFKLKGTELAGNESPSLLIAVCATLAIGVLGRGGVIVVSALAYCADDPSLNPAGS